MKTVLFIDSGEGELWDSFLRNDYVLKDWFCEENVAICPWHSEGCSVSEAIPDLSALLGDEKEWNAVIVTDLRHPSNGLDVTNDRYFANPYDFPENYDVDFTKPLEESQRPIIRLTQMLGGIPDRTTLVSDEGSGIEHVNTYEIVHPRSARHFDLMERYRLGLPMPRRLLCITPRECDERLIQELNARRGDEATDMAKRFWERNGYALNTRFVVVDFKAHALRDASQQSSVLRMPPNMQLERSWLEFWMSVLTITMNEFSSNSLRAFKLYTMSVLVDAEKMIDEFSYSQATWMAARELVRKRMELEKNRVRNSEFGAFPPPNNKVSISINVQEGEAGHAVVKTDNIGLFRDEETDDLAQWESQYDESMRSMEPFFKYPRNAVKKAVLEFRQKCIPPEEEPSVPLLSQSQIEDLQESLRSTERNLAKSAGFKPASFGAYKDMITQSAQSVTEAIRWRSLKGPTLTVLCVGIVMFALGMLPAVFSGTRDSLVMVRTAIIACVGCALVTAVGACVIVWQRKRIRDRYDAYNDQVKSIHKQIDTDYGSVSSYVSDSASFKRGWILLERQHRNAASSKRFVWLTEREEVLSGRIQGLDRVLGTGHAIHRRAYRKVMAKGWDQLSLELNDDMFFLLHLIDPVSRPLNTAVFSGESVIVPFVFISEVSLMPETLRAYVPKEEEEGAEI